MPVAHVAGSEVADGRPDDAMGKLLRGRRGDPQPAGIHEEWALPYDEIPQDDHHHRGEVAAERRSPF